MGAEDPHSVVLLEVSVSSMEESGMIQHEGTMFFIKMMIMLACLYVVSYMLVESGEGCP